MKKILTLLAIFMVAMTSWADTASDVSYVDADGTSKTTDATVITSSSTSLAAGWYVVNSSVTISSAVTCNGDVNLILADGASLNVNGISVGEGNTFTVYAQSAGTGKLTSTGSTSSNSAGIGGNAAAIIINGGNITANGGGGAAGIGTNYESSSSYTVNSITINGGVVTATGGNSGAGIGTGYNSTVKSITINGGVVTATGGLGGEIAGIGRGNGSESTCSSIAINGGVVYATGGYYSANTNPASAIIANDNNVTISSNLNVWGGASSTTYTEITNAEALEQHYVMVHTDYLCFTSQNASTTVAFNQTGTVSAELQYSTDLLTWNDYTFGNSITLSNAGDKVYFRANGTNSTFSADWADYITFTSDKNVSASGNVMSLLDANCSTTTVPIYAFRDLFYNCNTLLSAPKLPATTLNHHCYSRMFQGCSGLTTAPELPAENLAEYCYDQMFYDCTALTDAPALPATTLAQDCYDHMFYGCTSLTTAPYLPATNLTMYCYYYMFYGCSKLDYIKVNFTSWNKDNTGSWLQDVASTGKFICPLSLSTSTKGGSYIPSGWTVCNIPGTKSIANIAANGSASYTFTPEETGFYEFAVNNANIYVKVGDANEDNATYFASGTQTCGLQCTAGTKYTIGLLNTASDAVTGLTLTIEKTTLPALTVSANTVNLPKLDMGSYSANYTFTPEEDGVYKFVISNVSDGAGFTVSTTSAIQTSTIGGSNDKGVAVLTNLVKDQTYYIQAGASSKAVENATLTISNSDVMDKAVYNNGTLTFYCDETDHSAEGTVYKIYTYDLDGYDCPAWNTSDTKANVTKVVFDCSFADACPTSCYNWFTGFTKLSSVEGMKYVDMSDISSTYHMFYDCTSLKSIEFPTSLKALTNEIITYGNEMTFNLHSYPVVSFSYNNSTTGFTYDLSDDSYITTESTDLKSNAAAKPTYTRTMNNQWGTIVLPFDAENGDDYDLYTISAISDGTITLSKMVTRGALGYENTTLLAGTPALVRLNSAKVGQTDGLVITSKSVTKPSFSITTPSAISDLTLTGVFATTEITDKAGYIIANNAFWNIQTVKGTNKVYCAPFRAYLAGTLSGAKSLDLNIEDEDADAIEAINAITSGTAEYYDLNGCRLNDLQKGINIVKFSNGTTKKVIIK